MNQAELIMVITNRGFSDEVMEAAREAGATGGTIVHGRGSAHAQVYLDKLGFQPEKEITFILVKKEIAKVVMQAIQLKAGLTTPASGVSFALPISHVSGIKLFSTDEISTSEIDNQDKENNE